MARGNLGEFVLAISEEQKERIIGQMKYLREAERVLLNSITVVAEEQGVLRGAELEDLRENISQVHKRSIELMEFMRKSAVQQEGEIGKFTPEVEEIAHLVAAMDDDAIQDLMVHLRRKAIAVAGKK